MPNRMLREGILDSKAVNAISEEAELLYRRLYSIVDDYGRFEFDEQLIRARAFPRQMERWTCERIHRVLRELTVDHGYSPLITVYNGESKKFFQINKFGQRCQAKSKYPDPSSPWITVDHGDSPSSRVESSRSRVGVGDEVESKTDVNITGKVEVLSKPEELNKTHALEKTSGVVSKPNGHDSSRERFGYLSDESYTSFVVESLRFWPDLIDEDLQSAWQFTWKKLDFEQKALAVSRLKERIEAGEDPRFTTRLPKYLENGDWKRPLRPKEKPRIVDQPPKKPGMLDRPPYDPLKKLGLKP